MSSKSKTRRLLGAAALIMALVFALAASPSRADQGPDDHGRNRGRGPGGPRGNDDTSLTIPRHGDDDTSPRTHDEDTTEPHHGPIVRPHPGSPTTSTLTPAERFEVVWLKSNIILHRRMIAAAAIENAQTTSTELKTFSADFQTTLGQELNTLRTFLITWYQIDGTSATLGGGELEADDDSFELSHADGDLRFLRRVISYERTEINLAATAILHASHPALVTFAQRLLVEGGNVLALVNGWLDVLINDDVNHHLPGGEPGDDNGGGNSNSGNGGGGGSDSGHGGHGGDDGGGHH